ncbi:MAG: carboxymuconolactone decarboxylase family protein [Bacteroidetes bacterium]|jgi:uncharacterized peroxidase-related enzyme|nr:carboxymuconolactone decarboxylase family protein [Bacteroidota bacterium]
MTTFKIHNTETAPAASKEVLEGVQKQNGFIPNLYGLMANSPQMVKAYSEMGKLFGNTSFSSIEQQVIWLTVSRANSCHYCVSIHSMVAKKMKVDQETIQAIRNDKPTQDTKLEALRKFTKSMVEKQGWASEEDINAFLEAGYSKEQIMEVIVGIAQKTLSNYLNHIAQTPIDEVVKPYKWEAEVEV